MRKSSADQHHVVNILTARPPFGGHAQYAWRCTCGDSQAFSGPLSISSTWTSAQMHAYLWGGLIA